MADNSLAEEYLSLVVDLLSATTAIAVFYTLILILYCLSFRLCYAQLRDDQGKINRQRVCTLAFQTLLLICATLDVIIKNRLVQVTYIDDNTLFGGPHGPPAASVATLFSVDSLGNIIENILILGVLTWRVRVVWSGTRLVMPFTVASLFLYLITVGLEISYYITAWHATASSPAELPRVQMILYIVLLAFAFASSVFMTSAIIARLLFARQKHIQVMGRSDVAGQYLGIAAMLMESYALDTVWAIGAVVSFSISYLPTLNLFNNCGVQVDILSNYLLIYRVLSGRSWTRETENRLSTLRWAPNGTETTASGAVDLRQTTMVREDPPVMSSRNNV